MLVEHTSTAQNVAKTNRRSISTASVS